MKKLAEWLPVDNDVELTSTKVKNIFDKWYRNNIIITHGKDNTLDLTFGFPYTSTSSLGAGLWNVNCQAHLKNESEYNFKGLMLGEKLDVIALFESKPYVFKEIKIGKIKKG